jgi:hypothetical protein
MTLSADQIERFIADGFVAVEDAFSRELAEAGRAILWRDVGDDPAVWTRPVLRLGDYAQAPFAAAANTPALVQAYDQLVGPGCWFRRTSLGGFVVRFPSPADPGDTGWRIDASFALGGDDEGDFLSWRVNLASRGRALLLLFLYSDVGEADAPTRIRVGSHADIARRLQTAPKEGVSLRDLAAEGFAESAQRPEALATGPAGTVYLCHPFLVHAGQRHRGKTPKFMAQPPLFPATPWRLTRDEGPVYPVKEAILRALEGESAAAP